MLSIVFNFDILRFWVIGTFVFPVILFHWYKWLDARFVGAAAKTIVQKMLLDQFLISPPILVTFYVLMSIMERRDDIFTECRSAYSLCFFLNQQGRNKTQTVN